MLTGQWSAHVRQCHCWMSQVSGVMWCRGPPGMAHSVSLSFFPFSAIRLLAPCLAVWRRSYEGSQMHIDPVTRRGAWHSATKISLWEHLDARARQQFVDVLSMSPPGFSCLSCPHHSFVSGPERLPCLVRSEGFLVTLISWCPRAETRNC